MARSLPQTEESPVVSPRSKPYSFRIRTSVSRHRKDTRPRSIGVSPRLNPRDISGFLDSSVYRPLRLNPYSVHVGELNQTNAVLRQKLRMKAETVTADSEDPTEVVRDELHEKVLASLQACRVLATELDLTQDLLRHQRFAHTNKQDRFIQWKAQRAEVAENQSLLDRRYNHSLNHSFEFSMRRPHSATRQDYYAGELLGTSEKATLFSQLLRDAFADSTQSQSLYEALDLLIEARSGHCGRGNATLSAVAEDVSAKLGLVLDAVASEASLVSFAQFLTQQFRFVIKEAPEAGITLSLLWKSIILALEKAIQLSDIEIERGNAEIQETLRAEEIRIAKAQQSIVTDLQIKLAKAQEEIKHLVQTANHLRSEKMTLADLLRDRDDEISSLKLPPNLKDFDHLLEEMSAYLEEAEGRQVSQAGMLETISVMLDTTRIRHAKHKQRNINESPKSAVLSRPSVLARGHRPSILTLSHAPRPSVLNVQRPSVPNVSHMPRPSILDILPVPRPSILQSPPKVEVGKKSFFLMPPQQVEHNNTQSKDPSESDLSEESDEDSLPQVCDEQAQTDLVGEIDTEFPRSKVQCVVSHPILRELQQVKKRQPPLSESAVSRFMEHIFEEQFRHDVHCEEQKQAYTPLSEFVVNFVYMQSGLRTVARKTLSGVMSGLEKMTTHVYGQLLCKLLGVYDCGSTPPDLSVFLAKAQAAFVRLQSSPLKHSPDLGGAAPLVDVSDLVSLLFKHRWESAGRVLDSCLPGDVDLADTVRMLLCGKLAKLGRDLKYFFVQVDTEKRGAIALKAFAEGVKNVLGIALSWERMERFWTSFETEQITFQQLSSLNVKDFTQRAESKHSYITRHQFLTSIVREYEFLYSQEMRQFGAYFQAFDINSDGVLTMEEFRELVLSIDPEVPLQLVVRMYRKALEETDNGGDAISGEVFGRLAVEEKLGGSGKLGFDLRFQSCDPLLRQVLEREYEPVKSAFKRKGKKSV